MTVIETAVRRTRLALRDVRRDRRDRRSRFGEAYALTLLTPIKPQRGGDLARYLQNMPTGENSPLARCPEVHFARFVRIERLKTQWPGAPRRLPELRSEYLLFSADLTVSAPRYGGFDPLERFLDDLLVRMPEEVDAIWGHCWGYPGTSRPDEVARYFRACLLPPALYYAAYRGVPVADVKHAVEVRDGLIAFVRAQPADDDALRTAYLKEADKWFGSI